MPQAKATSAPPGAPGARRFRELAPGEILFAEGDPGSGLLVIQSGRVRLTRKLAGREQILAERAAGEIVGEIGVLVGRPQPVTAVAVEPTRCLLVEAAELEAMVAGDPEIAVRLVRELARNLDAAVAKLYER
ncbi:MAG: cyclic nucleotide-binding domain-containing protein [Deltaproteobacteria bacterium]|nr:cyclic nucleotide-binding domain-containing protein [Deltaproteobacteria bacterium]